MDHLSIYLFYGDLADFSLRGRFFDDIEWHSGYALNSL